jgi:hypothetical protein
MPQFWIDVAQVVSWLVASIGGVIAAFIAISQSRRDIFERMKSRRWKQAEMAKIVLDEVYNDEKARSALYMLDWNGRVYSDGDRLTNPLSTEAVLVALRTTNTHFQPDEMFVRDCFDRLFDYLERIEHYINISLITFEDVEHSLLYYVNIIASQKMVILAFLEEYNYKFTVQFLRRFPSWKDKA